MPVYHHILVPTDFSTHSEVAAAKAKQLAIVFGARITVLHVVDYVPPGYISIELPPQFSSEERLLDRARGVLNEWVGAVGLDGATQVLTTGSPKSEVLRTAREYEVDLVVMGTAGVRGLHGLLGSTTNAVIHNAPCDILSVQAVPVNV